MGGCRSIACNTIATAIWNWAMQHRCWLTSSYIEESANTEANMLSRVFNDRTEWQLDPEVFLSVCQALQLHHEIDLFASRINIQLPVYM